MGTASDNQLACVDAFADACRDEIDRTVVLVRAAFVHQPAETSIDAISIVVGSCAVKADDYLSGGAARGE